MSGVERYVREVLRHIDAPPRERRRIEGDLRAHLEDAVRAGEPAAEAVVRMGSAKDVAAELMAGIEHEYARPWRWLKMALTWLATLVLGRLFPQPPQPAATLLGIALILLFAGCVRRLWPHLT